MDHSDEAESRLFRRLMSHLLNAEMGGAAGRNAAPLGDASIDESFQTDRGFASTIGGGIGSSPLNPSSNPPLSEGWGPTGSKRTREEAETDEAEMASSVSSLMSGDDGGSEMMLSASQVLQHRMKKSAASRMPAVHVREDEGRPSMAYKERMGLYRELIEYFNPELVEPRAELGGCIEVALGC